jgi:hypothetical protein
VLRRKFGLKRNEVIGGWRKLHNEDLPNLYSLPGIIITIKSRKMKWTEYVECMGRTGMPIGFWWESQKKSDRLDDIDVDERIILRRISGLQDVMVWIGLICLRIGVNEGLL